MGENDGKLHVEGPLETHLEDSCNVPIAEPELHNPATNPNCIFAEQRTNSDARCSRCGVTIRLTDSGYVTHLCDADDRLVRIANLCDEFIGLIRKGEYNKDDQFMLSDLGYLRYVARGDIKELT